tara:strand:- start:244 stop:588 length:345 start_codon:yes stop_codon:yes gene_type:complete
MTTQLDMHAEIETLLESIKTDYLTWTSIGNKVLSDHNNNMIAKFNASLAVLPGRKYIKVVTGDSVWGFIVAVDNDARFPKGTILKAAGYNAPARNMPRGNIIEGGYTVCWTGTI